MEEIKMVPKRVRDEVELPGSEVDSPPVKRSKEGLLDGLDYDLEICTWNEDLDSFLKSFEEEITVLPSAAAAGGGAEAATDAATDLGKCRPDLGYLLEASDEELGIPPPAMSSSAELTTELVRVASESSEFGIEFCEVPDYGGLDLGSGIGERESYINGEYEGLGDLFDYSDLVFGSGDYTRRPPTLPAL